MAHAAGGWGQVCGNLCSSVRAWTQRHHPSSRQDAAQLRECIQPSLPPNRFDQNCFYLPRHRSLGDLVLPTSFGPSVWHGRHPCNKGIPWPPCCLPPHQHLNARTSSSWTWRFSTLTMALLLAMWVGAALAPCEPFQVRSCWGWRRPARRPDWPFSGGASSACQRQQSPSTQL
jgi:hypothetical protein